jgi:prepilin-type N-terminal cleavage/methylation domain-containing protein
MSRPPSHLTPVSTRRGFTLPELLIVIVMISLLALVAVPRFATANGRRHMESARMRVAAGVATARAAAIQKGQNVTFRISAHRATVFMVTGPDTLFLMSPVPLDTLYRVRAGGFVDPLLVDFSSRGFANLDNAVTISLQRTGVPNDSVVVTKTGMVQR